MPRPPKSVEQHKRDGTYQPCRHANRADSTPSPGTPEMPSGLTDRQRTLWHAVATYLPPGVVGAIDETALRDLVRVYGVYDTLLESLEKNPGDSKLLSDVTKAHAMFWSTGKQYGLTPESRAKIKLLPDVPKKSDKEDPVKRVQDILASRN